MNASILLGYAEAKRRPPQGFRCDKPERASPPFSNAYAYERSVSMSAAVRKLIAEHVPRKSEWFMARRGFFPPPRPRMWPRGPAPPPSFFFIGGGSHPPLLVVLPTHILRLPSAQNKSLLPHPRPYPTPPPPPPPAPPARPSHPPPPPPRDHVLSGTANVCFWH